MASTASSLAVPAGLVAELLDGPVLCAERIEAGRRRAAGNPVDPVALADAVVAEGRSLRSGR